MSQTISAAAAAPCPAPETDWGALAARHGLQVSGARPPLLGYLRELWSRRQFITAFATARLSTQFSQARLGQIWQVVTPLLNAAVYYFIYGVLLGTSRGVPDFIPFLVTGVFVWSFTAHAVAAGTRAISANLGLVRALHFPRAALPISLVLQQFQALLYSLAALTVILIALGQYPGPAWLVALPALLLQVTCNAGLSLVVARLGAKTPDVAQLTPFVLRVWMYLSGVMWSVDKLAGHSRIPHPVVLALECNPAAVYIDLMRFALIDSFTADQLPLHVWALAIGWAVLIGAGGFVFFWRAEGEYGRG